MIPLKQQYKVVAGIANTGMMNWKVAHPCGMLDSTLLQGQGISPDTICTSIRLYSIEAEPGERVAIYVIVRDQEKLGLSNAPRQFEAKILLNKTILYVDDPNVQRKVIDVNGCELVVRGIRETSDTLSIIRGLVTLGNTDYAEMEFRDFVWMDTALATKVVKNNGSIRVLGVCESGGIRLILQAGVKQGIARSPNPAKDMVHIEYGIKEPLNVTIEVINMSGQVVSTLLSKEQRSGGVYNLKSDIAGLSSGVYQVRMTTQIGVLSTRLDVVRYF